MTIHHKVYPRENGNNVFVRNNNVRHKRVEVVEIKGRVPKSSVINEVVRPAPQGGRE